MKRYGTLWLAVVFVTGGVGCTTAADPMSDQEATPTIIERSTNDAIKERCPLDEVAKLRAAGIPPQRVRELCGQATPPQTIPDPAHYDLRKRAEGGDAEAAFELGEQYELGVSGVMRDYVQAYAWYSKAYAISGDLKHKSALDTLESKMQPADIERAQSFDAGMSVSTKRSSAR